MGKFAYTSLKPGSYGEGTPFSKRCIVTSPCKVNLITPVCVSNTVSLIFVEVISSQYCRRIGKYIKDKHCNIVVTSIVPKLHYILRSSSPSALSAVVPANGDSRHCHNFTVYFISFKYTIYPTRSSTLDVKVPDFTISWVIKMYDKLKLLSGTPCRIHMEYLITINERGWVLKVEIIVIVVVQEILSNNVHSCFILTCLRM